MVPHQWEEQGDGISARHRPKEIELNLSKIVEAVVENSLLAAKEKRLCDVVHSLSSQVILIVGPHPLLLVEKAPVQFEEGSNELVRVKLALAQCFKGALLIDLSILEIPQRGDERSPGSWHLGQVGPAGTRCLDMEEVMDKLSKEKFWAEMGSIKRGGLCQQADGKLEKRQEMDVQEREALLNTEKPFETLPEGIGRDNNGQWS